jgi:membrane carboxypeptidase/penicillin-binding protein
VKKIIDCIARTIYTSKYAQLRAQLLIEFEKMQHLNKTVNLETLSKLLISGEDHRFYYHSGFDVIAIIRAIRNRVFYNKIEGASTIEQQLVRVLTNNFEKKYARKMQEVLLATTITCVVPKNTIPKIYLTVAYYGTDMNGLNQAITKLKVRDQEVDSLEVAAELVSRIKYPEPRNPSQKRQHQIEIRKQHLMFLYKKHSIKKYFKIYDRH